MAWKDSIQTASFKGVVFNVVSIEDSVERSIVEHQYAYAEGVDLEDMGSAGHEVTLTAIFWGDDYEGKLDSLLAICEKREAGLLVHPILGRLPKMQLFSAHFRHEEDNVDYVEFDLVFKKAVKSDPIFEYSSLFGMFDDILNQVDSMLDVVGSYYDNFTQTIRSVNALKSRVRGITAIVTGMGAQLKYQLKELRIAPSSSSSFKGGSNNAMSAIYTGAKQLVGARQVTNPVSSMSEYDSVKHELNKINQLPIQVAQGNTNVNLGVPTTLEDSREIQLFTLLITLSIRIETVVEILERDDLNQIEVEAMINDVRNSAQEIIDRVRQKDFMEEFNQYDELFTLVDTIRATQHSLKLIAELIISKKPPLIVRKSPLDGTLHQVAFEFYQDFTRYEELLHLNPHLTHPCFIQKGDFINGYSE